MAASPTLEEIWDLKQFLAVFPGFVNPALDCQCCLIKVVNLSPCVNVHDWKDAALALFFFLIGFSLKCVGLNVS